MEGIDLSGRLNEGLYKVRRKSDGKSEREHLFGVLRYGESVLFSNMSETREVLFIGGRENDGIKRIDRPLEKLRNDILLTLGYVKFEEISPETRCFYLRKKDKVRDAFCKHYKFIQH